MSDTPPAGSHAGRRLVLGLIAAAAVTIVVLAFMAGAVGGPGAGSGPGGPPSSATLPPVPIVDEVVADGYAMPVRTAELGSATGGRILGVPVALGDAVVAGDGLVVLDPGTLPEDLDGARAAADAATARAAQARDLERQATAQVAVAEANLDGAQSALERARDNKAGVADARAARDAARAQVVVARAGMDGAGAAVRAADAEVARSTAAVKSLEVALDALTIRSPFAGVVVSVPAVEGATATPGQVLVRVADESSWTFVTSELDESGIARVARGAAATVTLDGIPGASIAGTVARIGGYGSRRQGGIVYEAVVVPTAGVPEGVRWGMTATISIKVGE